MSHFIFNILIKYILIKRKACIPLSIVNADGSRRTTQKSKLAEIISSYYVPTTSDLEPEKCLISAYIVDLIAPIRTQTSKTPDTFEEFILKILTALPRGFYQVDRVANTYRDYSVKSSERHKRGSSDKVLINSLKSKIPRDLNTFLKNNDNKNRLIDLIFEFIIENRERCLFLLNTSRIVLSKEDKCLLAIRCTRANNSM